MNVKDVVAARLLDICKAQNITKSELATRSGVAPSTVYSIMDPKRRTIEVATVKKLCDGLDMTLREFFSTNEFDNLEQEIK